MKAQSDVYIKLQNVYKDKAREDAAEVLASVRRAPGGDAIDPAEVDLFCKNAAFVKLIDSPDSGPERLLKVAGKLLGPPPLHRRGPCIPASQGFWTERRRPIACPCGYEPRRCARHLGGSDGRNLCAKQSS